MSYLAATVLCVRVILVLDFPAGLEAQGRDAAHDLFRRWVAPRHL